MRVKHIECPGDREQGWYRDDSSLCLYRHRDFFVLKPVCINLQRAVFVKENKMSAASVGIGRRRQNLTPRPWRKKKERRWKTQRLKS